MTTVNDGSTGLVPISAAVPVRVTAVSQSAAPGMPAFSTMDSELIERFVPRPQRAVGFDERKVYRASDGAILGAMGVRDKAVVQYVSEPADPANLESA